MRCYRFLVGQQRVFDRSFFSNPTPLVRLYYSSRESWREFSLSLFFFPSPRLVVRGRIEAGDCEAGVDRGDRPGVSSGWGGDLPRNRSTCSWHQKLALTTSNNSSKPSSPPRRPLDTPFKLQGPERRIDRCTHAPLVSTVVLNMWSASRSCSLCSMAKIKGGNREGIIAVPARGGKNSELFAEQPAPFILGSCSP